MRAFVLHGHGGLDRYRFEPDWPEPAAGAGEALVRVRACGLNHLDAFVRRGMPGLPVAMPRVPGGDIAGEVADVGAGVDRAWIGRRVLVDPHLPRTGGALGEHADGGLCERIAVDARQLIAMPDGVGFEQAAALPIAYGTAQRMLARGAVRAGESVLILGASGGVGVGCVQLAKAAGAAVIACASSAAKLERLAALGADHLIDTSREEFSRRAWEISGRRGVDVCINYTGGETWVPSLRTLRPGGRMLVCGATAGYDPKEDLRFVWVRELDIRGCNGWTHQGLVDLLALVGAGTLAPVIHRTYRLEDALDAFRAMEDRTLFGKLIVCP